MWVVRGLQQMTAEGGLHLLLAVLVVLGFAFEPRMDPIKYCPISHLGPSRLLRACLGLYSAEAGE